MRAVIIYYPIFRNAGTALKQLLELNLGPGGVLNEQDRHDGVDDLTLSNLILRNESLRWITSHYIRLPLPQLNEIKIIDLCFIRHPVDRFISMYHYLRKRGDGSKKSTVAEQTAASDFLKFLIGYEPCSCFDPQVSHVANQRSFYKPPAEKDLRRAIEVIDDMRFLGCVDLFDESLRAANLFLHPMLPDFNFNILEEAVNVAREPTPSLDIRLEAARRELGEFAWNCLHEICALDITLWRHSREEVLRRFNKTTFLDSVDKPTLSINITTSVSKNKQTAGDLERFTPEMSGRIAYEHKHRYAVCRDYITGKYVLDVACGEGYGSNILAEKAHRVIGVDINPEVIQKAKIKYRKNTRLDFQISHCLSLPFSDSSFDAVISLETIEHISEQIELVHEISRVLKSDGVFIVSTPNRVVYSEETGLNNFFHKKELNETEFRGLLENKFKYVEILGQRFYIPSLIGAISKDKIRLGATGYQAYVQRAVLSTSACIDTEIVEVAHPQYFLAFCSNAPIDPLSVMSSIYIDEADDLWREHEKILRWASGLHEEDEILRQRLRESEERIAHLQQELNRKIQDVIPEQAQPGRTTILDSEVENILRTLKAGSEKAERTLDALQIKLAELREGNE